MALVLRKLENEVFINEAIKRYPNELVNNFNPSEWLSDPNNVALTDGKNIALFEREKAVWNTHWLFESRGREAISVGKAMLKYMFDNSDAAAIKGLTPAHCRAARWFNRQLGGKSYGMIDTVIGPCELFILERE